MFAWLRRKRACGQAWSLEFDLCVSAQPQEMMAGARMA
jgi:hypothetical protein